MSRRSSTRVRLPTGLASTFLGHALIGNTFSWPDFPHYLVGCIAGAWIARVARSQATDSRERLQPTARNG